MKIIHVAATSTGAPWMLALLREQKRLGHDVAAILPSCDGELGERLGNDAIPCFCATLDIVSLPLKEKIAAVSRLAHLLRRLRPDVVHSHIINSVVTARLASWIADVPTHFGANAHPISMESDFLRPIEVGTSFCDAATIASCTYTHELMLASGIPKRQLELIFYAVDQSRHDPALADGARIRQELGVDATTPVIGKIAYFYPPMSGAELVPQRVRGRGIKGHEVLIRAIPAVLKDFPDAKFVLVGRGWGPLGATYEQELKELTRSLGVEQSVIFPGERTDIPDVLAAFDVSVQCSLSDNLGGTVESLLMARPFVASDIRGFADTVVHEETGLAVPVDDPESLAESISRLLRDRDLGRRLGDQGRRRMLERFTLAKTVADLEELMARRRPRRRHYSRIVSAARIAILPFRVLPIYVAVHRQLRRSGFSFRRIWWWRVRYALSRAIRRTRRTA